MSVKHLIKSFLKYILKIFGYKIKKLDAFCTDFTDENELSSLINKLSPVSTDKELIRLGPKGDGGYLVPDDLKGIEACFSPGVDTVSGFEKDCADFGMKVFLADKSVDEPAESHELFHFSSKHIGVTTNKDYMTLDDWVALSLPKSQKDLMLQIDIEGCEYEVFLGASDSLMHRFRIIVAEFHALDSFWGKPLFDIKSRVFEKILQTHTCIHLHPNNCDSIIYRKGLGIPPVMEFTFLRNDRVLNPSPASVFPHPLDCDNNSKQHLVLPSCWCGKR
jgi:Methyltransferase FkbM domain